MVTRWLGRYARKPLTQGNGYLHEKGHPEPWIVMMDDETSVWSRSVMMC
ncbi:MAG: hypothetical protein LBD36_01960 [Holosporales bacterium]|nr:hypothetical protein [Holosporales bacterium]